MYNSTMTYKGSIVLCVIGIFSFSQGIAQSSMQWFNPNSKTQYIEDPVPVDCDLKFNGIDSKLGIEVVEFEAKPLLVHTHPQVQKWMKNKYLLECSANIYKAEETTFLLLHLKINSENAKHAYGNLEKGSQLKIIFNDGEHIYLDNIERDRGTAQRSKGTTTYEGIYPLSGYDIKELGRKSITTAGIVWEEGYQEYDVQNFELLKQQINCLKNI